MSPIRAGHIVEVIIVVCVVSTMLAFWTPASQIPSEPLKPLPSKSDSNLRTDQLPVTTFPDLTENAESQKAFAQPSPPNANEQPPEVTVQKAECPPSPGSTSVIIQKERLRTDFAHSLFYLNRTLKYMDEKCGKHYDFGHTREWAKNRRPHCDPVGVHGTNISCFTDYNGPNPVIYPRASIQNIRWCFT